MKHTLDWHIGRSSRGTERLDSQPFVACFYWKRDGVLVESAKYTKWELDRAISEMKTGEPYYDVFLQARDELIKSLETVRAGLSVTRRQKRQISD